MTEFQTTENEKILVLFDGVCNLCSSSVQFIISRDKKDTFRFASLQSQVGSQWIRHYNVQNIDSVVVIYNKKAYTQSSAAIAIAKRLGIGWNILATLGSIIPTKIRDRLYNFIAKRRYQMFGKKQACWLPSPEYLEKFLN